MPLAGRKAKKPVAFFRSQLFGNVQEILAPVAVLRQLGILAKSLPVPCLKGICKQVNLMSCVIYVELSGYLITAGFKQRSKAVAYCSSPGINYIQWACRVCADKLKQDTFAFAIISPSI